MPSIRRGHSEHSLFEKTDMKFKTKFKIVIAAIIVALLVTFLVLNRQQVDVDLIFATVAMSRAVLVLGIFLIGFLLGWIAHSLFKFRIPKIAQDQ